MLFPYFIPQALLNVLTEGRISIHSPITLIILVVTSLFSLSWHFMWDAQMALTSPIELKTMIITIGKNAQNIERKR